MSRDPVPSIRVVLADDHRMFREGLGRMLAAEEGLDVVGAVEDGDALLPLIDETQPDVAIVDISMPGPGVAGLVAAIRDRGSDCRAVALTMHLEPSYARELMAKGLAGYVVKDAAFEELSAAVRAVAGGEAYVCRALEAKAAQEDEPRHPLTEREFDCLKAAAEGKTAKMIARDFGITERTVRFHFSNICGKFGVERRSQAVAEALRLRLFTL